MGFPPAGRITYAGALIECHDAPARNPLAPMTLDPETYASIAPVRALPQRSRASSDPVAATSPGTRMLLAGPLVAVASMLAALVTTEAAGVPLRDPDHVAGRRLVGVLWLVGLLIVLDVVVRAALRSRGLRSVGRAIASVRRERWTLERGVAVGSALVSFYVTYLAYRNLKSVVPLLRPGELFDPQLADLDRAMFGGHDPCTPSSGPESRRT
jgi:hypothetical protein